MTSRGSAFFPRASYTQLGVSWSVENTSSPIISSVIIRGRRRLGSPGRPQKKKPQQPSDAYSCLLSYFFFPPSSFFFTVGRTFSFFFRYKRFTTGALKIKKFSFDTGGVRFLSFLGLLIRFFLRRPKYICTLDCRQMAIVSVSELESAASGLSGFYLFSG